MSLTRTLAHNTALQIAGKIISTLLGLITFGLMTRSLGTEQFGWYITAAGFLQFVGIFSDFGFVLVVSNLLSEPKFKQETVLNTTFTWRLITATVFQLVAPLLFLFFPYPAPVKIAVGILTVSFFAIALASICTGYFRTKLTMMPATLGEVFGRAALLVAVALFAYGHYGFLYMVGAVTLGSLVTTIYQFLKGPVVKLQIDGAVSRAMFYKMWPTALSIIFNAFYLQGDRVILPLYVSATEVAYYGAAYRVLDVVIQIAAMMMGLIMPLVTYAWSRGLKKEFAERCQLSFDLLTFLLLPSLVGIWILATPIMVFVAGRGFAPAGAIIRSLSIAIVGICFGQTFGHLALSINRQKETLWVFIVDAILSLAGYLVFIPRYGVSGAIGVTIFSEMFAGVCLLGIFLYYAKVAPRLITLGKTLIASFGMGVVVYYLRALSLPVPIAAGGATFAILALLFKIISPNTIREVLVLKPVAPKAEV
ncbi:MAG: hypothetical protein EXS55_02710 [Candidatus Magasanikbacteria bacterium]|nr:hypothetical protein [Candidatus Magasanikbacteria bacterium]